jgi:hypothetical protein
VYQHIQTGDTLENVAERFENATLFIPNRIESIALKAVQEGTPGHGLLSRTLQTRTRYPSKNGYRFTIGPYEGLNYDNDAPRGTLKAFFDYIRNGEKSSAKPKKQGKPRKPNGSFTAEQAWWFMSNAQKNKLDELRQSGMFGGPYPPPSYFGAIDKGSDATRHRGQGFVDKIRDTIYTQAQDAIERIMKY